MSEGEATLEVVNCDEATIVEPMNIKGDSLSTKAVEFGNAYLELSLAVRMSLACRRR